MSRETDRRPAAPRGAGRPLARWRRKRRLLRASCLAVSALLVAGLLSSCSSDGRTTLVFFQFKGEAQDYFRTLAARFEERRPWRRGAWVVSSEARCPKTCVRKTDLDHTKSNAEP